MVWGSDVREELHDFTMALARAGVAVAMVPLEVFASWAEFVATSQDDQGPYIVRAGGAVKIRPVSSEATRTFLDQGEIQSFIERHCIKP